ncbi:hypothetical protein BHM03_00008492 [Ensete ventricosum]|nr:hypothetical protein BHM03_00008492 [Ensete ventricosum]
MLLTRQQKKNLNITDLQSYAMASDNAIDVKLEAFEARMEDITHTLQRIKIGRSESPKRSQCEESSDHKENQLEKGVQAQDSMFPHIRVDFLRWEDGDPTGWISHVERYFRFYKTQDASMVDIVAIHLEGDAIQWYDWFEHTHGVSTWWQFKSGLLICFRPLEYENSEIRCEVKARQPYTLMVAISFARIQEEQLNNDARRTKIINRPTAIKPSASPATNRTPQPKKLTREELRERSTKGLCWHCDEPWSREHRCKKGRLFVIEPIEDPELEEVDLESEEEDAEEEPHPVVSTVHALAGYANSQTMKIDIFLKHQLITVLIDIRSTNNFMDSKVAT